jgi:hypothetical protein
VNSTKYKKNPFHRRLLIAYLIDNGVNSVDKLLNETNWPKRTLQSVLKTLPDYGIEIKTEGKSTANRTYKIASWGAINKSWITENLQHINDVLE